jgi:hypothetical protein
LAEIAAEFVRLKVENPHVRHEAPRVHPHSSAAGWGIDAFGSRNRRGPRCPRMRRGWTALASIGPV